MTKKSETSENQAQCAIQDVVLPCPFCGSKDDPVITNTRQFYGAKPYTETDYYLECGGCGLTIGNDHDYDQWGDVYCDYSTREEALAVWNKRV